MISSSPKVDDRVRLDTILLKVTLTDPFKIRYIWLDSLYSSKKYSPAPNSLILALAATFMNSSDSTRESCLKKAIF